MSQSEPRVDPGRLIDRFNHFKQEAGEEKPLPIGGPHPNHLPPSDQPILPFAEAPHAHGFLGYAIEGSDDDLPAPSDVIGAIQGLNPQIRGRGAEPGSAERLQVAPFGGVPEPLPQPVVVPSQAYALPAAPAPKPETKTAKYKREVAERKEIRAREKAQKEADAEARRAAREERRVREAVKLEGGASKTPKRTKKDPKEGGPGSRLGSANRRLLGESDEEVSKLRPDLLDVIDIKPLPLTGPTSEWTPEEETLAMTWITSEGRFANFKLKKKDWFPKIAQHVLSGSKTVKQVTQWWYQQWRLFRAVRARQEHTGGESGGESGVLFGISAAALDAFEDSNHFQLLDEVAHDHVEVTKAKNWDSTTPLTDSEEEADGLPTSSKKSAKKRHRKDTLDDSLEDEAIVLLRQSIQSAEDRHKSQAQHQAAELALAQAREDREAQAQSHSQACAKEDSTLAKWELVEKWSTSKLPALQAKAQRLAKELEEEELAASDL